MSLMANSTVGRPPKYTSKKKLQEKIDEYFASCEGTYLKDENGKHVLDKHGQPILVGQRPPTTTGLALALGFNSRQSLLNYKEKEEFLDTITRAYARIEQYTEERLFDKDGANGAKFSLANNFEGWKDKKSIDAEIGPKLEDLLQ